MVSYSIRELFNDLMVAMIGHHYLFVIHYHGDLLSWVVEIFQFPQSGELELENLASFIR